MATEAYGSINGTPVYVFRDSKDNIIVSEKLFAILIHSFEIVSKIHKSCENCFTHNCKGCVWDNKTRCSTKWNDWLQSEAEE